eukprot:TRINITY_DN3363_c0_g1_i1.p1 TRINITY_DN3363_c0_g1~~TRINITY_DN3363_c0_g1_i1.p1  ORF type:complete len:592 (-),score=133.99 TRINITY_DN3363_c0_g1_i1:29-1681(-)
MNGAYFLVDGRFGKPNALTVDETAGYYYDIDYYPLYRSGEHSDLDLLSWGSDNFYEFTFDVSSIVASMSTPIIEVYGHQAINEEETLEIKLCNSSDDCTLGSNYDTVAYMEHDFDFYEDGSMKVFADISGTKDDFSSIIRIVHDDTGFFIPIFKIWDVESNSDTSKLLHLREGQNSDACFEFNSENYETSYIAPTYPFAQGLSDDDTGYQGDYLICFGSNATDGYGQISYSVDLSALSDRANQYVELTGFNYDGNNMAMDFGVKYNNEMIFEFDSSGENEDDTGSIQIWQLDLSSASTGTITFTGETSQSVSRDVEDRYFGAILAYAPVYSSYDFCSEDPCANAVRCNNIGLLYTCDCELGWTGDNCDINIPDCPKIACLNNGTCVDGVNSYTCDCPPGFEGDICEININECEGVTCSGNGVCLDLVDDYYCSCSDGSTGKDCEEIHVYTVCDSHPCENGICFSNRAGDNYICVCENGFSGINCDVNGTSTEDVCMEDPCQNGICFSNEEGDDYICVCEHGFSGKDCDEQQSSNAITAVASVFIGLALLF